MAPECYPVNCYRVSAVRKPESELHSPPLPEDAKDRCHRAGSSTRLTGTVAEGLRAQSGGPWLCSHVRTGGCGKRKGALLWGSLRENEKGGSGRADLARWDEGQEQRAPRLPEVPCARFPSVNQHWGMWHEGEEGPRQLKGPLQRGQLMEKGSRSMNPRPVGNMQGSRKQKGRSDTQRRPLGRATLPRTAGASPPRKGAVG